MPLFLSFLFFCATANNGFSEVEKKEAPRFVIQKSEEKDVPIAEAERRVSAGAESVRQESLVIATPLHLNPEVSVLIRVPMQAGGVSGSHASNVIFYAPFLGEGFFKESYHNELTFTRGYTEFTCRIKNDPKDGEDRRKRYYYKESGWNDLVFFVQDYITQKYRLEPRRLIVVGESLGACMGAQMGVNESERIDAVAFLGGRIFDPPQKKSRVAWLAINSWGDSNSEPTREFVETVRAQGQNIIYAETPPSAGRFGDKNLHHSPGEEAYALLLEFIRGVVALREPSSGGVAGWLQRFLDSPWRTLRSEKAILSDAGKWSVVDERTGVRFPSEGTKKVWMALPHEAVKSARQGGEVPIIVQPPPEIPIKGVLAFFHDDTGEVPVLLMDYLYYLAKEGFVTVSRRTDPNPYEAAGQIGAFLDWVLAQEAWKSLPLSVVGTGEKGRSVLLALKGKTEPRIRALSAISLSPVPVVEEKNTAMEADDAWKVWAEHPRPILLFYGGDDTDRVGEGVSAEEFRKRFPQHPLVRVEVLKGVGADLGKQCPEAIRQMREFFNCRF